VTAGITAGSIAATSHTGTTMSASGNITGGNLTTAGILSVNSNAAATAIVNGAANAVGNIGSSTSYFNNIFAQATTALYADLAEVYESDADYAPGTVVRFGGSKEVTISSTAGDPTVAGVISANPSYLMNNGLTADHRAIVALTGRIPTSVTGTVYKGSMMVAAGNGCAMACATPAMGTVIGKALENFDGESGMIEIVVGRM
jgi:urease beta subunit